MMPHLILFMTERMSLRKWVDKGQFEREIAIYRRLAQTCRVTIISYGTEDESGLLANCPGIEVKNNREKLPSELYIDSLDGTMVTDPANAVVKTNQFKGAHLAARFSKRLGVPLIVRGGYLTSAFVREKRTFNLLKKWFNVRRIAHYEHEVLSQADRIVVTTPLMQEQILSAYPLSPDRIRVVPNYVDTQVFASVDTAIQRIPRQIIFIGRLESQKNLFNLIQACAKVSDCELVLVGDGSLRHDLELEARRLQVKARFAGQIPNALLPELLASASLFVLPSLYEGHPKTLIEAMCTGIPVLGTRVEGIRECIQSEVTGLLCEPDVSSLSTAIERMLNNPAFAEACGAAGKRFAIEAFSLDSILTMEMRNIQELLRSDH